MSQRVPARLARLNPTTAFLLVAGVMLLGLILPGIVGAAVLSLLAAGVVWLLSRAWAAVPPQGRAVRVAILALLVAVVVVKAT